MVKIRSAKFGILLCTLFMASFISGFYYYYVSATKEQKLQEEKALVDYNNSVKTNAVKEDIVTKDTKISFKIEYRKSEEIFDETNPEDTTSLIGKNRKEIEDIYALKGYIISEMNSEKLVLLKSFDKYSPGKYILNLYKPGKCIAIYKTDEEGNETLENIDYDIKFDTKLADIKEGDLETILRGSKTLQFDTREEAEDGYNSLFKS